MNKLKQQCESEFLEMKKRYEDDAILYGLRNIITAQEQRISRLERIIVDMHDQIADKYEQKGMQDLFCHEIGNLRD